MLKPDQIEGELPSSKEAYLTLGRLALPSVIEMVLSSLIGSVDTIMVSKLGTAAITAVGLTGQPRMLILAIFFALNVGVTAVVARRKGEGRRDEARATLNNAIVIILMLSVALTALGIIFARPFMRFAGSIDGETTELATEYFRIIIAAAPINALTMCINAAQRGIGNTKITMYVNTVSNVVNVIFNYLLIGGNLGFPALGVRGAAIASVIGMVCGFVLSIISVTVRDPYLRLDFRSSWKLSREVVDPVIKVGGNAVVEQIALRFGFFAFARIIASLGTDDFAVHQICVQFISITFTIGDGLGVAGTSLVGRNLGANRPDLSMIYGKVAQRVALIVSLVMVGLLYFFRTPLVSLFSEDQHIIALASQVMVIVAVFQPFQTSSTVIAGCLRGAGDTKFVALVMILCIAVIRPGVAMITVFGFKWGIMSAWITSLPK